MQLRYGIFGGSFDPPHLGHVLGALWALETGEIDRVLIIPVGRHAFGKQAASSFEHRLEMCRLAFERLGGHVEVCDIEGRREGTSFMIDTLRQLTTERPSATFRLVVGSDVAAEVAKWREGAEVLRLAPLLELPRPQPGETFAARPNALPPISSTMARQSLRQGSGGEMLLPRSIRDYIAAHQLYTERQP
jgi:nicotinate-nucleotide adenylyltransferase